MRTAALLFASLLAVGSPAAARTYGGREVPDEPRGRIAGTTPISQINANTAQGFSPLEFFTVDIQGVVQLGTGNLDPFDLAGASAWFYVSDGTGGLAIARPAQIGTAVSPGDRVNITSTVFTQGAGTIRGTRTLDLGFGGTVTVIGSGTVDAPVAVTAADIATNGVAWEGTRVRIDGLTIVNPLAWPVAGASGFVNVTDGVSQFRIFVDDDTNLDGSTPPGAAFDLIGFVAQDDAPPFDNSHFVWPASLADLVVADGSGTVVVSPAIVPEDATGVTLAFTLTGQQAVLETVELDIPTTWGWTQSAGDVALSGAGFAAAAAAIVPGAPVTIRITGAAVGSTAPGTLTLSNLASPAYPGTSAFPVRTAVLGGTPTVIASLPVVTVVTGAGAGDVVVNELLAVTSDPNEESEFIELWNRAGVDLDISGWTLADIGRATGCVLDARWAFPAGTTLPAGAFAVVARTALDPRGPGTADDRGFRVSFPGFAGLLFEMYDPESAADAPFGDAPGRTDDPATPNLVLLDATARVDDQIALLGGAVTNGGQCESPNVPGRIVPFGELVVVRDVLGAVIDAVEYREIGPCVGDICTGPLTGADDAYPFGAPKPGHSLGRDASGTDTDSSKDDLLPASVATPGAANQPGDTVPPALVPGSTTGVSASVIEIRYDEAVDEISATTAANYSVSGPSGEMYAVREVLSDVEEPQRHYLIVTDPMPASLAGTLSVSGVIDLVIGGSGGNVFSGSAGFVVPAEAVTVCDVQQFDATGFSPRVGQTVLFAGFVTLGDLPASAPGAPPPSDRVSIWVQEPGGCGVNVFSFLPTSAADFAQDFADVREFGVRLNHFVRVRGVVTEFVSASSGSGAVTEVAGITGDTSFYELVIVAGRGPAPVEVSTAGANDERLEGTLVHTEGTVINANALAAWIDDGSGSVQVFQNFSSLDLTRFTVGDRLDVTGVMTQFDATEPYLSGYELVPQNQDAISKVDGSFASDGPSVEVGKRILVPELGETIGIFVRSPHRSDIIVEIYDAVGRKITTLYDGVGLGEMAFEWDGRDQRGSVVEPGVYLCHARAVALDGGRVKTFAAPIVVGLRLEGPGASIE